MGSSRPLIALARGTETRDAVSEYRDAVSLNCTDGDLTDNARDEDAATLLLAQRCSFCSDLRLRVSVEPDERGSM